MSARHRARRPLARRRAKGQSIPLIALMILVLVAMVGLSVDVGNTFSEEREAVLAANSASLNAMNEVLKRDASNNQRVYDTIQETLAANRVNAVHASTQPGPGQITWRAFYLDREGQPLASGAEIKSEASRIPPDVAYVNVVLNGEVDTYFARVVGRDDLPIAASAYAGVCPASKGVYPIGVNEDLIDKANVRFKNPGTSTSGGGNAFNWRWTVIDDPLSPYLNKTRMRIPLHHKFPGSTGTGGNFGYMNWTGDPGSGSAGATAERMWFPGNLDKGYKEVPVSQVDTLPNFVPGWEPNNVFEVGDWVWGDNGFSFGGNSANGINQALLDHIQRGTEMILPIYDNQVEGNGANAKFKIVDMGLFVATGVNNGGTNAYIELIYLGDPTPNQGACNISAVAPNPDTCCELVGDVSFVPQYELASSRRTPVRYVIVMDVSGSMAANFAGMCNHRNNAQMSSPVQCTASTAADGRTLTPGQVEGTGGTYRWGAEGSSQRNERRIVIARNAVKALIDITNMQENSGYQPAPYEDEVAFVTFGSGSGDGRTARFNNNGQYAGGGGQRFSSNPAGIKDAVDAMMPDYTSEGTNAAAGLYQAYRVLSSAPDRYSGTGQRINFKNVVILVTDGISNQQFHPSASNFSLGRLDSRGNYPPDSRCANSQQVPFTFEDAECMQNRAGWRAGVTPKTLDQNPSTSDILSRPITQVGEVSKRYLKAPGPNGEPLAEVFTIGLSGATIDGQGDVVSGSTSTNFLLVRDGNLLDDTFRNIYNRTNNPVCQPGVGVLTSAIPSTQFPATAGLAWPQVGTVTLEGRVFKTNTPITPRTAPIIADTTDGNKLKYRFTNVPPGEYTLTATLYYNHPEDAWTNGRAYTVQSIPVTVSDKTPTGSLSPRTEADLELSLNGTICPQPPPQP